MLNCSNGETCSFIRGLPFTAWGFSLLFFLSFPLVVTASTNFQAVFDRHNAVMLLIDPANGKIVDANQSAVAFYGYSRDQMRELTIQRFNTLSAEQVAEERDRAKKEKRNFFIFNHELADGSIRTVQVFSNPMDWKGKTLLFSIIVDITNQKKLQEAVWHHQERLEQSLSELKKQLEEEGQKKLQLWVSGIVVLSIVTLLLWWQNLKLNQFQRELKSEQAHLEDVIQGTRAGMWRWDVSTGSVDFSDRTLEILGYSQNDLEPLNIEKWADLLHPEDLQLSNSILKRTFSRKQGYYDCEVRMRGKKGDWIWIHARGSVSKWSDAKKPVTMHGTLMDISKRKIAEEGLRRSQKMEAIGQMAGGIAHDFNNVLGIMLGHITLLRRGLENDPKALKRVETITASIDRASDLTKNLLSFARDNASETKVSDINQIILGMEGLVSKSVTPKVEIKDNLDYSLWLAEVEIGQFEDSLLNLILNARDAMPDGGTITITTRNVSLEHGLENRHNLIRPGEYISIEVADTGDGIAERDLIRIFDPFFTTKEKGKGTGLGLSMVFGFAKRMNGGVEVKSFPHQGTAVTLYLPRSCEDLDMADLPKHEQVELPRGTETILVVDDEIQLANAAKEILQGLGYKVIAITDPHRALQQVKKDKTIDLLFSDVVMPGEMNGYELAAAAQSINPELRILLTTGYSDVEPSEKIQDVQDSLILRKPYSDVTLARAVKDAFVIKHAGLIGTSLTLNAATVISPIHWSDEYVIGIENIDKDHEYLFSLYNKCLKERLAPDKQGSLTVLISELIDYTESHFGREEELMDHSNYPNTEEHILQHDRLVGAHINKGE